VLGLSRSGWPPELASQHPWLTEVALDLADAPALAAWLAGPTLADALAGVVGMAGCGGVPGSASAGVVAQAGQVLLVNNAGLVSPIGPPGGQGAAAVMQAVALNVAAPLALADAWVAATAGVPDRRIVHISSGAARNAYAGWSVYCATKAALDMHARAVQLDAVAGLRIESLAPGVIDTGMQAHIRATDASQFPLVGRFQGLHRDGAMQSPSDVARRLLAHVLGETFGAEAVRDLRDLHGR
jgi:NAD(P)-dependent dehydrogenase (short-subunit alcohol dehydrogenase family)